MDSFEWEVFKNTGDVSHYLLMKQREDETDAKTDEEK